MVDGYFRRIPFDEALPSQGGEYWIFYKTSKNGSYGRLLLLRAHEFLRRL
ncbi:MAG TPA: hypothetical protein VKG91_08655 [Roseiarcus sp.]|nr:hypothetical protein [Roseiarcus sp.]